MKLGGNRPPGEVARTVQVKNKPAPVKVREITVRDATDSIRVSLWQDSASLPIATGTAVLLKDVTLSYSEFHKTHVLQVNDVEEVQVLLQLHCHSVL